MHGVPHDECFGVGGTLARSAREGAHVVLVCATRGEVGEIANPVLATPETLGEVRQRELYCSAEALAAGVDTSGFDRFEEGSIGWPDERVQITLDVSATVDAKWQAFQCHRTQFGPENPFQRLTPETMKRLLRREYLAIAWPEPEPGLALHDLLEGL